VGSAVCARLRARGDRVIELVRGQATAPDQLFWNPASGELDEAQLSGIDGVIHLAGENVAKERWSPEFKRRIRDSRVQGTRTLVAALEKAPKTPPVLISASGVGFYGDRGDAWVDEDSAPGEGFLADVCQQWEAAARRLDARARTVQLRLGMVLSDRGGALGKMLPAFRVGVGGPLGSGEQYVSWITLEDLVSVIERALDGEVRGPVNAVSPNPVVQREFARALGEVLRRPALLPVPGFALRLVLGELSQEALTGQRVRPQQLLHHGFAFRHTEIVAALRAVLA
jgi:uncharacterized protein (TIGR01777 family)